MTLNIRSGHQLPQSSVLIAAAMLLNVVLASCTKHGEQKTVGAVPDGDTAGIAATWEDISLEIGDFHRLLNANIRFGRIYDYESLEKSGLLEHTIQIGMQEEFFMREAVRLGADTDQIFNDILIKLARQSHLGNCVVQRIRSDLPSSEIIDKSEPGEEEMRKHFKLFTNQLLDEEFHMIHHIFFGKDPDDPGNNILKKEEAMAAVARIKAGEDFVDLKMELTETRNPKPDPEPIPRYDPGMQKLREQIEKMEPGEISDVIDGKQGYYIIYYLPEQNLTEEFRLEDVLRNPSQKERLARFTINKRPRTKPVLDYVDEISGNYDFEIYDHGELDEGDWPPRDTVLVRVDSDQYTLDDLITVFEYQGIDPREKLDLDFFIPYLKQNMILSRKFADEAYRESDMDLVNWRILSASEHRKWLMRHFASSFLDTLVDPGNREDAREEAEKLATEYLGDMLNQMKQEMKVMVTTDNLNMETVQFSSPPMDVTY